MKSQIILLCLNLVVAGCASRSQIHDDHPLKGISNLYNRNKMVAIPTFVGNAICGAPFALLSTGFDAVYVGKKTKTYHSIINNVFFIPASACGAVTGLPFIPFSYAFDESPISPLGI